MLNPYHEKIPLAQVLELQRSQYEQILHIEKEVPANSQTDAALNLTGQGAFMLLSFTGSYTTKTAVDADDGINHLYAQLVDGANKWELFDSFVPLNLIFSPGRVRAVAGLGDASQPLRLEYPFIYTFPYNSQIIWKIRNDAAFANTFRVAMKGIRITD